MWNQLRNARQVVILEMAMANMKAVEEDWSESVWEDLKDRYVDLLESLDEALAN